MKKYVVFVETSSIFGVRFHFAEVGKVTEQLVKLNRETLHRCDVGSSLQVKREQVVLDTDSFDVARACCVASRKAGKKYAEAIMDLNNEAWDRHTEIIRNAQKAEAEAEQSLAKLGLDS